MNAVPGDIFEFVLYLCIKNKLKHIFYEILPIVPRKIIATIYAILEGNGIQRQKKVLCAFLAIYWHLHFSHNIPNVPGTG